jgi:glycosyltransferase involved in cell wall biosynthesis
MKICVVTPVWGIAGVPLAQRRLALALVARGHQVDFIIGWSDPALTIPDTPGVNVLAWNVSGIRYIIPPLIRYLKTAKPDVVFSAEDHLNGAVLVAATLARSKAKISGSSRVPPKDSYSNTPFTKGWLRKQTMRLAMRRADALTCVSEDMVTNYRTYFPDGPHVAVHNIIDDTTTRARAAQPVDHPWFTQRDLPLVVAAGTLTGRKNFKMLVAVMGELKRRGRDVRLALFGEGYRRPELEAQIAELDIVDRCWLPGRVDNPLAYFAHADVLALTSYAEGLPNVLVEGMVAGCTPVATDCPTGPREVIEGGGVGHLVAMDDVPAMADAIERALAAPATRVALDRAIASFREEVVIAKHFGILGIAIS